jgi:iron complex outermembrane receptor protein
MRSRNRRLARPALVLALGLTTVARAEAPPAGEDAAEALPTMEVEGAALDDFRDAVILPEDQSFVPADNADLLRRAPGANVNKNGPLTGISQYRGMYGSRVNTLIDGLNVAPAGPNWMDPPLSFVPSGALQDLTLVRGISPVSAGSETIGGTVRAELRQGEFGTGDDFEPHGVLGGGVRSINNAYDGNGLLWLSNRNHRLRLSGTYDRAPDDIETGNGDKIVPTEYKRWSAGGGYGFRDGERELGLSYDHGKTRDTGTPALPMDIIFLKGDYYRGYYEDRFGALNLEAKLHYNNVNHRMDNYSFRRPPIMVSGMPMRRYALTDAKDTAYDLRGSIDLSRGTVRFGTDGWLPKYNADVFSPDNSAFFFTNYNNVTRDRYGLFGEWQGDLLAGWELQGGARYTRVESNADQVEATGLGMNQANADQLAASFNAADRDRSDNLIDLALILHHALSDSLELELGAAHKQRAPSYQERYLWLPLEATAGLADRRVYVGNLSLDPEKAYNLDLGLNWRTSRFYFTPRVFYKRVDDYIQGTPLTSGPALSFRYTAVNMVQGPGFCQSHPTNFNCVPLQFNNVDAEFYGADAGFGFAFTDRWRIDGIVNWVRGKRRDIHDNLYRIAPANGRLDLTYQASSWSVTAEGEYFAKQDKVSETNAEEKTGSYGLLHFYGRWWLKDTLSLRAGIRNLLDNNYESHLSGYNRVAADGDGKPSDLQVGDRIPGPGRDLFLQAEYSF